MSVHFVRPNGWIAVKYHGPENAKVEIGFASKEPSKADWHTAFLDYEGEERVATVPQPDWVKSKVVISFKVFLRINGEVQR